VSLKPAFYEQNIKAFLTVNLAKAQSMLLLSNNNGKMQSDASVAVK